MSRAVEIIHNLWLGDKNDAKKALLSTNPIAREIFCMHEDLKTWRANHHWFPIGFPSLDPDEMDSQGIDFDQLQRACVKLDEFMAQGVSCLVHCYSGVERGPLTVVYWLWSRGHFPSLQAAYDHVRKLRPIVQERTHWLPSEIIAKSVGLSGTFA